MRRGSSLGFRLTAAWWMLCLMVIAISLPRFMAQAATAPSEDARPAPILFETASSHSAMALTRPFPGCNAAHAAGYYDIPIGSPAYSPDQDGDGDGLACEPHRY